MAKRDENNENSKELQEIQEFFDLFNEEINSLSDEISIEEIVPVEVERNCPNVTDWQQQLFNSAVIQEKLRQYLLTTTAQNRVDAVKSLNKEIMYFLQAFETSDDKYNLMTMVICALLNVTFFRNIFSYALDRPNVLISETEDMYGYRNTIKGQVTSKPPGGQDALHWYNWVLLESNVTVPIEIKRFIKNIKDQLVSPEPLRLINSIVTEINALGSESALEEFVSVNTPKLDYSVFLDRAECLAKLLRAKVVGQDSAIDDLCDGYAQSVLRNTSGPRGIYTLMGAPGTGKTLLAEEFSNVISEVEGERYQFLKFNMEQLANEKDHSYLFGSGHFYTEAALGALTDAVRNYPKTIILFDEIEKAHFNVIQSLLGLLDKGLAKDTTSQEVIDFTQTFIFFTTNLGNDLLASRRQSGQRIGILNDSSLSSILYQKPRHGKHSALAPEFVSRLSKGRFLVFEPLKPEHLISVYMKGWGSGNEADLVDNIPTPEVSVEVATLKALTRLPDFSARLAANAAERDKVECLKLLVGFDKAQNATIRKHFRETRFIGVDDLLISWMEQRNVNTALRILIIDDDMSTFEIVKQSIDQLDIPCQLIKAAHGSNEAMGDKVEPIDIALIDIFIENDTEQAYISTAFDEITKLKQSQPDSLILGFCRNANQNVITYQNLETAKQMSGLGAVYVYDDSTKEEILTPLSEQIKLRYYSKLINSFHRERKRPSFQWKVHKESETLCLSPFMIRIDPVINLGAEGEMQGLGDIPDLTLKDVVGNERGVHQIRQALGWLKHGGRVGRFGFKPPSGYLLAGPPGTGKTFLAKAAAGECGLPFFSVNSAELLSSTHGTGEARLRKLFDDARQLAPAVIFMDEIDTIAIQRAEQGSHRGLVNTLLSEMDGFSSNTRPVLVLAATNYPDALDDALKRPGRLDEVIVCDLPNTLARLDMITSGLSRLNLQLKSDTVDELVQRTQGVSAAAIEAAIRQAVYLADSQDRDPTEEDVNEAFQQRIYGVVRKDLRLAKAEKWSVACHEAGHALAIHLRFPKHRIDYISIQPRTDSLGFVSYREESTNARGSLSKTRMEVEAELDISLAGREAERIMLGEGGMSTGATHDLYKANRLVRSVIMQSGLDNEIGSLFLTDELVRSDPSLASQCVERSKVWLSSSEDRVRALLNQNSEVLEHLANHLYKYESIEGREFLKLVSTSVDSRESSEKDE